MEETKNKNQKINTRIKPIIFIAVMFVSIVLLLFIPYPESKDGFNQELPEGVYVYYSSREVYKGDTVYDIAKEVISDTLTGDYITLKEEIEEIQRLNNLIDGRITSGKNIIVPYIDTETEE